MATIRRLIKASDLKENVPISKSVDEALLKKVIYNEQQTKIQNLLGTKLFNAIMTEASDNTITGKRKQLVDDYIKPALYQWSFRAAILHLNLRVTDKGVIEQSDNNAAQADAARIKQLRNDAQNKAEFHGKLAVEFICENTGDFPEYLNDDENGGVRAQKRPYDAGIVFSSRRKRKGYKN